MELLLAMMPLLAVVGGIALEVGLTLRLSPRYFRLVCRVPTRPVRLPDDLPDDLLLRDRALEVRVSPGGIQARSTRRKHHVLLRIDRAGQARAGAAVSMWLYLVTAIGVLGILAAAALSHPLLTALGLLVGIGTVAGGTGLLLRWRTRRMVDDVERLIAVGAGAGGAGRRRASIPETAG